MSIRPPEYEQWRSAIQAATAEANTPCKVYYDNDYNDTITYSWISIGETIPSPEAYENFHRACLLAEPLRPPQLEPSPELAHRISKA